MTLTLTTTLARLDAALVSIRRDPETDVAVQESSNHTAWRAAEWRIVCLFVGHGLCPDDPIRAAAEFHRQSPTDANRLALAAKIQTSLPRPHTSNREALDYLTGAAIQWAMTTASQRRMKLEPFPGGDVSSAAQWLETLVQTLETALTRDRMVRMPQPVVHNLLSIRAGNIVATPVRERRTPRDPSGRTFAAVLPDVHHWRLLTEHKPALALPIQQGTPANEENAAVLARTVLRGGVLKLYLATWALWAEGRKADGLFVWDPAHVLLDVYGTKPVTNTSHGRQYTRPHSKRMAELRADFDTLLSTWLGGIGDVECDPLQPLFYAYRRTKRGDIIYQHAPLAWMAMKHAFVQVPRAVLRLPATDVPLALGLAGVWRTRITTAVLRGPGHYCTTLQALATDLGEDCKAGVRQEGRAYWRYLAQRLHRVATASDLGTVHVEGTGPTAQVWLEPSESLATVYRPLAAAADQRHARAHAIEIEADIRSALAERTPRKKNSRNPPKR